MRNFFLILLLLIAIGGFFYVNPPHAVSHPNSNPDALTAVTQWFAPTPEPTAPPTPPPPPVWKAPINPQYPSEWTTTDGQKFSKVKVTMMEADAVTIIHSNGVAVVDLAVLPPDLQRTFDYIPYCAQKAAAIRKGGESAADQNFTLSKGVTQMLDIDGGPDTYLVTTAEHDRLTPYYDNLTKLKGQIDGYKSDLTAGAQKIDTDRTSLNHSDPNALASFNAEVKQYNDYLEWVNQQIVDYNSQVINYNKELKGEGKPKP